MRPARIVRLGFRIFLLICTLSLSIVSLLGGLSAFNILLTPGNVNVDLASTTMDVNFSTPETSYVNIPFSITNDGYFDLTDLSVSISLNLGYNGTKIQNIYSRENVIYGDIKKTETLSDSFNATPLNIPEFSSVEYLEINFTLNAWYSLRLLNIRVEIIDQEIPISFP